MERETRIEKEYVYKTEKHTYINIKNWNANKSANVNANAKETNEIRKQQTKKRAEVRNRLQIQIYNTIGDIKKKWKGNGELSIYTHRWIGVKWKSV